MHPETLFELLYAFPQTLLASQCALSARPLLMLLMHIVGILSSSLSEVGIVDALHVRLDGSVHVLHAGIR